jgi:PhoH-like ATPase
MVPRFVPTDGSGRVFVLDTNVLLYDPNSLFVFKKHEVVIPITVIEEIDTFKKDLNETGRNARMVSRRLDEMRKRGSLSEGVELPEGGTVRVELPHDQPDLPFGFSTGSNDNLILSTAKYLHDTSRSGGVVLVTRDTNMRVKADALGLPAEDYEHAHLDIDERFLGVKERQVPAEMIEEIYSRGWVAWEPEEFESVYANHFLILGAEDREGQSAMVRYDARQGRLVRVGRFKEGVWGIFARNKEQLFALDLLLDDSIQLVTLDGMAGTGKTLLAIAAGLKKVTDDQVYRKMLVSRPIFPLGRDVGFLPGDLEEKLNPWMKPIFDNLELLLNPEEDRPRNDRTPAYQALMDQRIIEVEPLTYIRGRSIPRQFLIVDEAQNLTPHEVRTVVTRAGEGTKVVLTGDPLQIDNPYVDATSNGLTYVVERFKESPLAGHVTLRKGERSELAEAAAELMR